VLVHSTPAADRGGENLAMQWDNMIWRSLNVAPTGTEAVWGGGGGDITREQEQQVCRYTFKSFIYKKSTGTVNLILSGEVK